MQAINETLAQVSNLEDRRLQNALDNTRNISDLEVRRAILGKILLDDRLAHNYEPRETEDADFIVQTFLPVTRSIPFERLYESYVAALEARQVGNNYQITAIEILQGWKMLRGAVEMESVSGVKRLAENAARACERCFGTGNDFTPDGARPCDHTLLTPQEWEARALAKAEGIRQMREEAALIVKARAKAKEAAAPPVVAPVSRKLVCSDCLHRGNTLEGWQAGEACTRKDCMGTMELV